MLEAVREALRSGDIDLRGRSFTEDQLLEREFSREVRDFALSMNRLFSFLIPGDDKINFVSLLVGIYTDVAKASLRYHRKMEDVIYFPRAEPFSLIEELQSLIEFFASRGFNFTASVLHKMTVYHGAEYWKNVFDEPGLMDFFASTPWVIERSVMARPKNPCEFLVEVRSLTEKLRFEPAFSALPIKRLIFAAANYHDFDRASAYLRSLYWRRHPASLPSSEGLAATNS